MVSEKLSIREEVEKRGYKVVYVPHKAISDYNACYNVEYEGEPIRPPAAEKLVIPLNEIWISEKWRRFEEFILHHELQEIKHRRMGYDGETAHLLAQRDSIALWKDDPKWREMVVEIHISDVENIVRGEAGKAK